jgi:mxaA protein
MQKIILNITTASLLWMATVSFAADTAQDVQASAQPMLVVSNPAAIAGVHIGDVLTRTVTVEAAAAYQLKDNALPKKGSKHDGIELVGVTLKSDAQSGKTRYSVQLRYQVFAASTFPTVMHLPAEKLILVNPSAGNRTLEVPAWGFWFSPLVAGGTLTAKKNLLPEVATPLIESQQHKTLLGAFFSIAIVSLLALLYINADGHWLPFMGGAFARAHRQLKRLARSSRPKTAAEEKKALVYLHQAFNQHYGANIFARDIDHFVTLRPGFKTLQPEITQFFAASNQSLYDVNARDSSKVILQLLQLSKQLRDCERGVA